MSERADPVRGEAGTQADLVGQVGVICPDCDWRYLSLSDRLPARCPHCAAEDLGAVALTEAEFPYAGTPELVVPFSVPGATLEQRMSAFVDSIPLPPDDLNPATLRSRLRALYFPMWLVDTDVEARWQAEVGFDYEVVSHQERYADGTGWRTEEVRETRVRWEPRVGQLQRHYENVAAPALTTHKAIDRLLGAHNRGDAQAFVPNMLRDALVRAPDRAPDAAWVDAEMGVRARAILECQQAAHADHLREFRWTPSFADRTWTLLLLPVYATYYLDDELVPRQILINGQTGQLIGARRGSLIRAKGRSLTIGIIAIVLLALSLAVGLGGILFPPLVIAAVVGGMVALLTGVGAFVPLVRTTQFNRREAARSPEV